MMAKTKDLTHEGYETDEVKSITEGFENLEQGEKGMFLGYALMKFGITRDMWYSRLNGRTKWRKLEIDALKKVLEEKPWRDI